MNRFDEEPTTTTTHTREQRIAELRAEGRKSRAEAEAEHYENVRSAVTDIVRALVENLDHIGGIAVFLVPRNGDSLVTADVATDPDALEPVAFFGGSIADDFAFGVLRQKMEEAIARRCARSSRPQGLPSGVLDLGALLGGIDR